MRRDRYANRSSIRWNTSKTKTESQYVTQNSFFTAFTTQICMKLNRHTNEANKYRKPERKYYLIKFWFRWTWL